MVEEAGAGVLAEWGGWVTLLLGGGAVGGLVSQKKSECVSVELSVRRTWDVPVDEERQGAEGRRCTQNKGKKKKDTYSNHHKKCELLRVVHMLLTRVQEVARPVTAPALTSRQVSFGGLGVDEMTSPLGTADWEEFFWCAG